MRWLGLILVLADRSVFGKQTCRGATQMEYSLPELPFLSEVGA